MEKKRERTLNVEVNKADLYSKSYILLLTTCSLIYLQTQLKSRSEKELLYGVYRPKKPIMCIRTEPLFQPY